MHTTQANRSRTRYLDYVGSPSSNQKSDIGLKPGAVRSMAEQLQAVVAATINNNVTPPASQELVPSAMPHHRISTSHQRHDLPIQPYDAERVKKKICKKV